MVSTTKPSFKYIIPPRPDSLIQLNTLMNSDEPDLDLIVSTLKQDPGLYSIVLATVNAPCFALRKEVTSITHAIVLLGLPRLSSLINLSVIKQTLSSSNRLERFWDTASEVASITHNLCGKYTSLDQDNAYSIGMLHDSGVPILIQADPNYKDFLRSHNNLDIDDLVTAEKDKYGIDHFSLGAKLIEQWAIPQIVADSVQAQAVFPVILEQNRSKADDTIMYLALLSLAKDISKSYRHFWRLDKDPELTPNILLCLEYIGLCDYDYFDLKEEYVKELEERP